MTSELRVDNLKGSTTGGSINVLGEGTSATTNLQQGLAKVWFFTETLAAADASSAVDDSFNVSSFTDDETGQLASSFTNNMSAVNFCSLGIANGSSTDDIITTNYGAATSPAWTTGSTNFLSYDGAFKDTAISGMVKGDLA
jgi:hypothetical protein